MTPGEKRRALRAQLTGERCLFPASIYDPLSARAAEEIGYETIFMAGSVASLVILGAPDLVIITLSELAEQTRRIARASSLPFFLDADHGFGNALSVMRSVQELEAAGLSGLTIEDTEIPDPFDRKSGLPLSIEEGVGKLKAALAARSDPDFVIIGRTGAVGATGLEDALKRIAAYQETGVDAIFLSGLKTQDEIEACAKACRLPLLLGNIPDKLRDQEALSKLGIRFVITGHRPHAASVTATYETLRATRDGTLGAAPPDESAMMERLTRAQDYAAHKKAFLTRGTT